MYRFLPVLGTDKQYLSFIEQDIHRFMELPKNLENEPGDQKQLESYEKLLKKLRETLISGQAASQELLNDYNNWLNENQSSQYEVKRGSDKIKAVYSEEKEEEPVFSDTEESEPKM